MYIVTFLLVVCVYSLSLELINSSKWKPGVCATNSQTVYQLIRAESLSVYMDHDTESCINIQGNWDMSSLLSWKIMMHRALQTFGMKNKEFQFCMSEILFVDDGTVYCVRKKYYFKFYFDFNGILFVTVLKPFTAKIKVIIHKGTETQASRMLVDIVLQDVAMQLSETQYATFCHIYDSLLRATVNR